MSEIKDIKPRLVLAVAAILILFLGLIFLARYAGSGSGEGQSSAIGNAPQERSGTKPVGERPGAIAISPETFARGISPGQLQKALSEAETVHRAEMRFHDARTANEASQAIELAESENLPVAKDWLAALEGFCFDTSEVKEYTSGRQWLDDRQSKFCAGYLTKRLFGDALPLNDLYADTFARQIQGEVTESLREVSASDQSDYITMRLKNARWPEEVQAIQQALAQYREQSSTGVSPWNPLERAPEDWRKRYSPTYAQSQDLALHMYRCYKFRSCAPDSIDFMNTCSVLPECEDWWTIDDYFYYTSTPLEIQTAYEILQKLQ